jgi:hypothetical protein
MEWDPVINQTLYRFVCDVTINFVSTFLLPNRQNVVWNLMILGAVPYISRYKQIQSLVQHNRTTEATVQHDIGS